MSPIHLSIYLWNVYPAGYISRSREFGNDQPEKNGGLQIGSVPSFSAVYIYVNSLLLQLVKNF